MLPNPAFKNVEVSRMQQVASLLSIYVLFKHRNQKLLSTVLTGGKLCSMNAAASYALLKDWKIEKLRNSRPTFRIKSTAMVCERKEAKLRNITI